MSRGSGCAVARNLAPSRREKAGSVTPGFFQNHQVRTRGCLSGIVITNRVPRPVSVSNRMVPPWDSTSVRQMAVPSPVPRALPEVTNGSQKFYRMESVIPGKFSVTVIK